MNTGDFCRGGKWKGGGVRGYSEREGRGVINL